MITRTLIDRDLVTLAKEGECELNIRATVTYLVSKIGKTLITPFFVLFMHYTPSEVKEKPEAK